jgi:hypothetical protein
MGTALTNLTYVTVFKVTRSPEYNPVLYITQSCIFPLFFFHFIWSKVQKLNNYSHIFSPAMLLEEF